MPNFTDEFMQSLGPQMTGELSQRLGIGNEQAEGLIPKIVPMILAGLKKQKDNRGGDDRIDHILDKYGNPSHLEDLGQTMERKFQLPESDPDLGGLLEGSGSKASGSLSESLGINKGLAMKIIPMLAPIILGYLTRKRNSGVGTSGIGAILDRDGDGRYLDDVAGWVTSAGAAHMAGGRQGGGGKSGIIGMILNLILGLFRRR